jgi:methylated-DNA-[protein]-cysteine S-methyltransferase
MAALNRVYYHSPIGIIEIVGNKQGVQTVNFVQRRPRGGSRPDPSLRPAVAQLDEYFRGRRREFSLALCLEGTEFQKKAWRLLAAIPFGETATYAEVAAAIGRPKALRAIGQANHRNPISIIIPCHRVIGHDGRLVGYGSGLWRKRWLLDHERSVAEGTGPAGGERRA